MIGVNILLGKDKGTATDVNGKFELDISSDWESFEVTFSCLGYETPVVCGFVVCGLWSVCSGGGEGPRGREQPR